MAVTEESLWRGMNPSMQRAFPHLVDVIKESGGLFPPELAVAFGQLHNVSPASVLGLVADIQRIGETLHTASAGDRVQSNPAIPPPSSHAYTPSPHPQRSRPGITIPAIPYAATPLPPAAGIDGEAPPYSLHVFVDYSNLSIGVQRLKQCGTRLSLTKHGKLRQFSTHGVS